MPELMRMPGVAAGATEAILAAWNVEPGKPFSAGDVVVTVETDKAVVDVEADHHLGFREIVALSKPID